MYFDDVKRINCEEGMCICKRCGGNVMSMETIAKTQNYHTRYVCTKCHAVGISSLN